jgi:ABC-2 type transport system permease protein
MNLKAIYRIAERDLLAQLRSRSFFVQTVLMPLVLTLILGTALGGSSKISPVPVGLVGEDDSISQGLEKILVDAQLATVRRFTRDQGEAAVREGRLVALVELPDNTRRVLLRAGSTSQVRIFSDAASRERALVIEQVTRAYLGQIESGRAAVLGAVQALKPPDAPTLGRYITAAQPRVQSALEQPTVQVTRTLAGGRVQGLLAYYAVAFGVMFTLLSVTNGASGLLDEIERGTIARLLSAPLTPTGLIVAKFASLLALAIVQLGLFALATWVLYGASWGAPLPAIICIIATAAAAAGFGGVVIGLAQSHEQVSVISLVFVLVMSLLGGSIWPIETLPGLAQGLSRLTYNRWAIEGFQTLSVPGLGLYEIWPDVIVLLVMGAIGLAFGAVRLSRGFRL